MIVILHINVNDKRELIEAMNILYGVFKMKHPDEDVLIGYPANTKKMEKIICPKCLLEFLIDSNDPEKGADWLCDGCLNKKLMEKDP